jgi:hypothetical protein
MEHMKYQKTSPEYTCRIYGVTSFVGTRFKNTLASRSEVTDEPPISASKRSVSFLPGHGQVTRKSNARNTHAYSLYHGHHLGGLLRLSRLSDLVQGLLGGDTAIGVQNDRISFEYNNIMQPAPIFLILNLISGSFRSV